MRSDSRGRFGQTSWMGGLAPGLFLLLVLVFGARSLWSQAKVPEGADAHEPNNSRDQATRVELDKEIEATIFPRGDIDFYRFTLDQAARVNVRIKGASPAISLLAQVREMKRGTSYGDVNAGPGRDLLLVADLPAGEFTLEVRDGPHKEFEQPRSYDVNGSKAPYRLVVSAQKVPDLLEPNDDEAKPAALELGKTQKIWIFPAGDRDCFKFDVPNPGRGELRITAANVADNISLAARLSTLKTNLGSTQAPPGEPLFWKVNINAPGEHRLVLEAGSYYQQKIYKGPGSDGSLEPIELKVEYLDAGDPYEPNPDFAQAASIPLGKEINATLFPAGDRDYYKLNIPPGQRGWLRVDLDNLPDSIHPYLGLFDKNRNLLRAVQRILGEPVTLIHGVEAGDYYLLFHDQSRQNRIHYESPDDTGSLVRYSLRTSLSTSAWPKSVESRESRVESQKVKSPTAPLDSRLSTLDFENEHEPNDSFDKAEEISLGQKRLGTLLPEGDNDYFKFTIKEGDPDFVQLAVTGLNPRVLTRLNCFREDRREIAATPLLRDGTGILNLRLTPGNYFFRLGVESGFNGFYHESTSTQFQSTPYEIRLTPLFQNTLTVEKGTHHLGEGKLAHFEKPEPEGLVFRKTFEVPDPAKHDAVLVNARFLAPDLPSEQGIILTINGQEIGCLNRFCLQNDPVWRTLILDLPGDILKPGKNEISLETHKIPARAPADWEFRFLGLGKRESSVESREKKAESGEKLPSSLLTPHSPFVPGTWQSFRLEGESVWFETEVKRPGRLRVLLPGPHLEADPAVTLYRLEKNRESRVENGEKNPSSSPLPTPPLKVLYLRGRADRTRLDELYPELTFQRLEAGEKEAGSILLKMQELDKFDAVILDGLSDLAQFDLASEKARANLGKFAESGRRVLIVDPLCSLEKIGVKNVGMGENHHDRTVDLPISDPLFPGKPGLAVGWPHCENGGRIEDWQKSGLVRLAGDALDPKVAVTAYLPVGKGAFIIETMQLGNPANHPQGRGRLLWLLQAPYRLEFINNFDNLQGPGRDSARLGTSPLLEPGKYLLHIRSPLPQRKKFVPMLFFSQILENRALPGDVGASFEKPHVLNLPEIFGKEPEEEGKPRSLSLGSYYLDHNRAEQWFTVRTSRDLSGRFRVESPEELDLAVELYRGRLKATGKRVLYLHGPFAYHNLDPFFPDITWERHELDAPASARLLIDPFRAPKQELALEKYDAIIIDTINNETQFGLDQQPVIDRLHQYVEAGGRLILLTPLRLSKLFGEITLEAPGRGTAAKTVFTGDQHELLSSWETSLRQSPLSAKYQPFTTRFPLAEYDEAGAFSGWKTAGTEGQVPPFLPLFRQIENPSKLACAVAKKLGKGYIIFDSQRVGAEDTRPAADWKIYLYLGVVPSAERVRIIDNTLDRTFGGGEEFELPAEDAEWCFRIRDKGRLHWSKDPFELRFRPLPAKSAEEPNDTHAQATPLEFGKTVQGKLLPSGDRDVYKLEVSSPGVLRVKLDHPADNIDAELTLETAVAQRRNVFYLQGGRPEYDLYRRRLSGVDFTVRNHLNSNFILPWEDNKPAWDAIIVDGLTDANHFGLGKKETQDSILKYVEQGGTFILLTPQIQDPKDPTIFWGAKLVPGWRKNNVVVIDEKHLLHQRRAMGSLADWPYSVSSGHLTGLKEAGFEQIYADVADKEKTGILLAKKVGKGWLILDTLEVGYPGNGPSSVWHVANLLDAPLLNMLDEKSRGKPGLPRWDRRILLPGTYYLTVADNEAFQDYANASPLPYTLRADFDNVPELADFLEDKKTENGEAKAKSKIPTPSTLIPGIPAGALLYPAGKSVWFSIGVPSPGKVTLDLTNVPDSVDPVLEFYKAGDLEKPWRTFDQTTGKAHGGPEHAEFETQTSETLFVRVFDREGIRTSLTPLRLLLAFEPVACPYEFNNDPKTALTLIPKTPYWLNLYPARDADWFQFKPTGTSQLRVLVDEVPADLAVRVEVYSATDLKRPIHSPESRRGEKMEFQMELPAGETFYVVLKAGGDGAFSPHLFRFQANYEPKGELPGAAIAGQWPAPDLTGTFPEVPIQLALTRPVKNVEQSIRVEGSRSGKVVGKTTWDPKTNLLTFKSSAPFIPGEKVQVSVADLQDAEGRELKAAWTFAVGVPRAADTLVQVSLPRRKLGIGQYPLRITTSLPLAEAPKVVCRLQGGEAITVGKLARDEEGKWTGTLEIGKGAATGPARIDIAGKDSLGRPLTRISGDMALEIDTTPPPAPTNLVIEARPRGKLALSWVPPADVADLAGFHIYRSESDKGEKTLIAQIANPRAAVHEDLPPKDGNYFYAIAALDEAGNVGPPTAFSKGVSLRVGPKVPVQNFAALAAKGKVTLSWNKAMEAEAVGYELFRFSDAKEAEKFQSIRPYRVLTLREVTTYDTPADGEYFYLLAPRDSAGNLGQATPPARVVVDTQVPTGVLSLEGKSPLVAGEYAVLLKVNEKLKADPSLKVFLPNNTVRSLPVKKIDDLQYQFLLKLTKEDPDGQLRFEVQGEDLYGNVGMNLVGNPYVDFDNAPPKIWVATEPESRFLSGKVQVHVRFGEPIVGEPKFAYQVAGKTFPMVLQKVREQQYSGTLELTREAPNGPAQFDIVATDRFGHTGGIFERGRDFVIKTIPPQPPLKLNVQSGSQGVLLVRWVPPVGESVSFFRLYGSVDQDFAISAKTLIQDRIHDLGFQLKPKEDKTLFLRVTAVDPAGNESVPTAALKAEPDNTPPPSPTDVLAEVGKDGQVKLSWKPGVAKDKEDVRFLVFRSLEQKPELARLQPLTTTKDISIVDRPPSAGSYYYHVLAEDPAGNRSPAGSSSRLEYDQTPPLATIQLTPAPKRLGYWGPGEVLWQLPVVAAGKIQVKVSFNEPLAGPPELRWRSKLTDSPEPLVLTPKDNEYLAELEIEPGKTEGLCQFLVKAQDKAGNQGTEIKEGERFWIDTLPPPPPATVNVERQPLGKLAVAWSVPQGERLDLLVFHLYRSREPLKDITGQKPLTIVERGLQFIDSPAEEGTFYYGVIAEDLASNKSALATTVPARSDTTPPPAPTQLVSSIDNQVRLTWQPSPEKDVTYRVYRSMTPQSPEPKDRLALGLTQPGFSDLPQTDGVFHYAVTAVDESGNESPTTNIVKVDFVGRVPRAKVVTDPKGPVRSGFKVQLQTTLPLVEIPQLFLQLAGRSVTIPLQKVNETQWQGNLELAEDFPSGLASFRFRGVAAGGFIGTIVESGGEITIDRLPPRVWLSLSRPSPLTSGTHQVKVEASEPLAEPPQLLLTTLGAKPRRITLQSTDTKIFTGNFALDKEDRDGTAVFMITARDLAGNETSLENFAPFAVDHHPPKPPTNLQLKALAGGRVELRWQAPIYQAHEVFDQIRGYNVYRMPKNVESRESKVESGETKLLTEGVLGLSMVDTPEKDGEYLYAVATLDASGLISEKVIAAGTSDRTPPLPPRITEVKQLPTGIGLAWESNADAGKLRYKVRAWSAGETEGINIAENLAGTKTQYQPLVGGVYTFRITALDEVGNESQPSIPQSLTYRQIAPVARITFARPGPWGVGPVNIEVDSGRDLEQAPKLSLVVAEKSVPVALTGKGATWKGTLTITSGPEVGPGKAGELILPAGRFTSEFQFQAGVKEEGVLVEGTGILEGREATFDLEPPTLTLQFGPGVASKDRQVLLKAGKVDFTATASEKLQAVPKLIFTPQGKDGIPINLVPLETGVVSPGGSRWGGSLTIEPTMTDKGLFEFAGTDLAGNVGREITIGRNVLLRTSPPAPVGKIRAQALPGGRVRIDWTAPMLSSGEPDKSATRFLVYRSDSRVKSVEGLTSLVEVQRLLGHMDQPPADREYFYTVVVVDDAGNKSDLSAAASVHVDKTPPGPPQDLVVSELPTGAVKLSWKVPAGEKPAFYRVYLEKFPIHTTRELRPRNDMVPFTEVYGTPNENGKYYFAVTAVDDALNESVPSKSVFLDYKTIAPMAFFTIEAGITSGTGLGSLTVQTAEVLPQPPQLVVKKDGTGTGFPVPMVGDGKHWSARISPRALFPFQAGTGGEPTYSLEIITGQNLSDRPRVFYHPEGANPKGITFEGAGQKFRAELNPRSFFRFDPRIWLTDGKYSVTIWTTGFLKEPPQVLIHHEGEKEKVGASRFPRPLTFTGNGDSWQATLTIDPSFPEGQYGFEFKGSDKEGNVGTEIREGPLFRVDRQAPLPPENVDSATDEEKTPGGVKVQWRPPGKAGADIPHYYRIYRARREFTQSTEAELVRVFQVTREGTALEEIIDLPPANGTWFYRITSVDLAGNESTPSALTKATLSSDTPRAEIRLITPQAGDAAATRIGTGGAQVVLTTNVPLARPPSLRWFLKSKPDEMHDVTLTGKDTRFEGNLKLELSGDLEEDAEFVFAGIGQTGFQGKGISTGRSFTVDTIGPEARIIIPSIYEMKITVKPEGGGELKIPPVKAGRILVNVELSEVPADVPALAYSLDGRAKIAIPLTGFGRIWHGFMDIPPGIPHAEGQFFFEAIDQAGNKSTKITRREYPREVDETALPPRTLRNFATTGGVFEVDSEPPAPPTNVALTARKLGIAEIRWGSEEKSRDESQESRAKSPESKEKSSPPPSSGSGLSSLDSRLALDSRLSTLDHSYRLYRSLTPMVGKPSGEAIKKDILARIIVDDPPVDGTYFYAVTAVDLAGNESVLSECLSVFLDTIKSELKIKAVPEGDDFVIMFPDEDPVQAEITLRFPGQKEFKVNLGGESGQLKKTYRTVAGRSVPAVVLPRQAEFFNGRVEVIVHSPDPQGNMVEALTESAYQKINSNVGGQVESPDGAVKFEIPAGLTPFIPQGPKEFKRVSGYENLFFIQYQNIPDKTPEAAKTETDPTVPDPVPPGLEVVGTPYTIHLNDAPKEPISLRASATQADLSELMKLKAKLTMKIPEYYSDMVKDPEYLKSRLKVIKWVPNVVGSKDRGRWEMVSDIEIKPETGELITPADAITTYVIVSERTPPTILDVLPEANGSTRSLRPTISCRIVDKGTGVAQGAENPTYLTIDGQKIPAGLVKLSSDDPTEIRLSYEPPADLKPGIHLAGIRAEDVVGNVANFQWRFTIDDAPPSISEVHPVPGSVTAVPRPLVSAILTDEGGINPAAMVLTLDEEKVSPDSVRFEDATGLMAYVPGQDLAGGEHKIHLTVQDRTGQSSQKEWTFVVDLEPPVIDSPQWKAGLLSFRVQDQWSPVDEAGLRLIVNDRPIPRSRATGDDGFLWEPVQRKLTYRMPPTPPQTAALVLLLAQDSWGNHGQSSWQIMEGETGIPIGQGRPPAKEKVEPPVQVTKEEPSQPQEKPEAKEDQPWDPSWLIVAGAVLVLIIFGIFVLWLKKRR